MVGLPRRALVATPLLLWLGMATPALAQLPLPPSRAQPSVPTSVAPPDMHWVAPGLARYTDDVLFGDVWERTDLTPRDRSMITLSALIAGGNSAQLTGHLNRALDNGVTPREISGMITHLAFYSGWPKVVSALTTARTVLEARGTRQSDLHEPLSMADAGLPGGVTRKGAPPLSAGPAANFNGTVRVSGRFNGSDGSNIGGATVTFRPGARTAWHRHSRGQTLVVTEGCGWTQSEGGAVEKVCTGDVVSVGAAVKHWHGATATTAMSHVALSEGTGVEWLEQVTDPIYNAGPR